MFHMPRLNTPPPPRLLSAKTSCSSHRFTPPVPSRLHRINTTISPLLRFSILNSALLYLYNNVNSLEFRKWLYNQIVELNRLPKALAKLPPQAHRDPVLTD